MLKFYITEKQQTVFWDKFLAKRMVWWRHSWLWSLSTAGETWLKQNGKQENMVTYHDSKTWKQYFNPINKVLILQLKLDECNKETIKNTWSASHGMPDSIYNWSTLHLPNASKQQVPIIDVSTSLSYNELFKSFFQLLFSAVICFHVWCSSIGSSLYICPSARTGGKHYYTQL